MPTLDELAKKDGYKGFGAGQGNAAFEKAAAENLANKMMTYSGNNYSPMQVANAVRAGDTAIPTLAGANTLTPNNNTSPAPVTDPTAEYKKMLDDAKNQRINATVTGLQNRFNQTVSDINTKRNALNPAYDAKKSQAQVGSQLGAKNFAEFLANRGLSRSGTAAQAEINRNMTLQNTFNQYDQQKADELQYYNTLEDRARSSLNSDISAAQSEAEASALDKFMSYKANQDTLKAQQDFQREQNAQSQALQKQQLLNEQYKLGETKRKDAEDAFVKTIGQYGNDYQAEINNIKDDGDPTNDWKLGYLEQARKDKLAKMLQDEVSTVGQYGQDYQAEINRRLQTPDTLDDRLIPFLQTARQEKLGAVSKAQKDAEAAKRKQDNEDRKYELDKRKTEYDINKPYYNPNSASENKPQKASPYFNSVTNQLEKVFESLAGQTYNNPLPQNQWEYGDDGKVTKSYNEEKLSDRARMAGTAEHKQVTSAIDNAVLNGQITPEEGVLLYNLFRIPG